MTDVRTDILARLQGVGKTNLNLDSSQHKAPLIPKRGQASLAERMVVFEREARYALADVIVLASILDVPDTLEKIKKQMGAKTIKAAPNPVLKNLDWSNTNIQFGIGEDKDLIGLSVAYAGVSETGTVVMVSGPTSPTTLNFLSDTHVVVLFKTDIEANYEAVWHRLQNDFIVMPRAVNWITGPSRTADIEQTMLLGAHGPRKLVILLIDEKDEEKNQ